MFNGSSAIENMVETNICTPQIRCSLRSNFYVVSASGIRFEQYIAYGTNWNNWAVSIVKRYGGSQWRLAAVSLLSGASVGASLFLGTGMGLGKFLAVGNTLNFFYAINGDGDLYKISSGDGYTWGGTQRICSSTSLKYPDIAPINAEEGYYLVGVSKHVDIACNIAYFNLDTGESRVIDSHTYYVKQSIESSASGLNTLTYFINAIRADTEDQLVILNAKTPTTSSRYTSTEYITILGSDTYQAFHSKDLIDSGDMVGTTWAYAKLQMSNIYQGPSSCYVCYRHSKVQARSGGKGGYDFTVTSGLLLEGRDLKDLSGERYLALAQTAQEGPLFITGDSVSISAYTGSPWGGYTSGRRLKYLDSENDVDLSQRIVSYSNRNNDRISLSLSNYS